MFQMAPRCLLRGEAAHTLSGNRGHQVGPTTETEQGTSGYCQSGTTGGGKSVRGKGHNQPCFVWLLGHTQRCLRVSPSSGLRDAGDQIPTGQSAKQSSGLTNLLSPSKKAATLRPYRHKSTKAAGSAHFKSSTSILSSSRYKSFCTVTETSSWVERPDSAFGGALKSGWKG